MESPIVVVEPGIDFGQVASSQIMVSGNIRMEMLKVICRPACESRRPGIVDIER